MPINLYNVCVPFEEMSIITNYIIAKFISWIQITYAYKWVITLHLCNTRNEDDTIKQ